MNKVKDHLDILGLTLALLSMISIRYFDSNDNIYVDIVSYSIFVAGAALFFSFKPFERLGELFIIGAPFMYYRLTEAGHGIGLAVFFPLALLCMGCYLTRNNFIKGHRSNDTHK